MIQKEFCKNSDRTLIEIVRLVRSLADRTFQLRRAAPPREPRRRSAPRAGAAGAPRLRADRARQD